MENKHNQPPPDPLGVSSDSVSPDAKRMRTKDVLGYSFLAIIAVSLTYYVLTFGKDVKAKVECPTIKGGYNCVVSLVSGSPPLISMCWEINGVCSNGVRTSVKKCFNGHLENNSPAQVLIANSDIQNYNQCDHISATSIENIELVVSNGIIQKGTFK